MEFSSLARIARRLSTVVLPDVDRTSASCTKRSDDAAACVKPGIVLGVVLVASLLLAGCGSSNHIESVSSTVDILSDSQGLATDSARNLYVANAGDHEIVLVTQSTGLLTVFAGNGLPGFLGDGGPAASAELKFPKGVAVDSSGNVYIADSGNNRIRVVTTAGNISTIAGTGTAGYTGDNGPAISAQLNGPQAVTLDASGNIYIADTGNNVIRKISGTTITTVVGNGTQCNPATSAPCGDGGAATSAMLNTPTDVKLDSSGNIYIADQADFVVREVLASSGVISSVAGSYVSGYSPTAGNSGAATSAQLNIPQAIALDTSGNLYIADTGNNIIRKVSGGTITTAVGNGTAGYGGDGGSPGGAELNFPNGLRFDPSGVLYIDDAGNKAVRTVKF